MALQSAGSSPRPRRAEGRGVAKAAAVTIRGRCSRRSHPVEAVEEDVNLCLREAVGGAQELHQNARDLVLLGSQDPRNCRTLAVHSPSHVLKS